MSATSSIFAYLRASAAAIVLLTASSAGMAQTLPPLGTAANFSVLGGAAITNTGGSVVTGDLGLWPGTDSSITGFPPGSIVGTVHAGNAVAQQAQRDLTTAYNNAAGQACGTSLTGTDLGGLTLTPGVYCLANSAQLTGTLTLDAQGDPNAVFIFQIGSTLTTASNSAVVLINGGSGCRVFWQVGSSATLGTGTAFEGNILALTSITATTGSSVSGRVLARNGAVTLDTNAVGGCIAGACPIINLAPTVLPQGTLGVAYNATVTASNGTAPYVYTVSAGALPTGLLLNPSTGQITGTPTVLGNFQFTITATDSAGCLRSRNYTVIISAAMCPAINLAPPSLPGGAIGSAYNQTVSASGGAAPYTYSITAGGLPPGLLLSSATGQIAGTLTTVGSFGFTVTATDVNFCVASQAYNIVVGGANCPQLSLTPAFLAPIFFGQAFSQTFAASGGTAPYTYSVTSGALPAGLSLNPQSGLLSGTPTMVGPSNFRITAIDALGCSISASFGSAVQVLPPQSIPAVSGWSLLMMLLGMLGVAFVGIRR